MVAQAQSGLMALHGVERRQPRRLGLDVASAVAGILASQAVLAALVGRSRGCKVERVETSVLDGALVFLSHRLPIATCGAVPPVDPELTAPGPPFTTADGGWVELEVLRFADWRGFWTRLGAAETALDAAWSSYALRYLTGTCALPPSLHAATRGQTLAKVREVADACGVAVGRLRTYDEVVADRTGARSEPPWTLDLHTSGSRPASLGDDDLAAGPLAGLRVVELATRLQGPLAGLLLQRLGAHVVKVEPPGGDMGRAGPSAFGRAAYLAYNRGKEIMELDYKRSEGRTELRGLAAGADVFLHNSRPGRAERLGFGSRDLARANPGLVYAYASGWGGSTTAPSDIAGDYIVQAHAACGEGLHPDGEPPFPSRLTLVDVTGGLLACEGILAGLCLRERTGAGCSVGTSLLAAALTLQRPVLDGIAAGREDCRRRGRPLWGPLDRPIPTADGFLAVWAGDPGTRDRLAAACGLHSSADDERIEVRLRTRAGTEWEPLLRERGVPAAVVQDDLRGLPRDPAVAPLLEPIDGGAWAPAAPWRFAR